MTLPNDLSHLSDAEKRERIRQLELELELLKRSISQSNTSPHLPAVSDKKEQDGNLKYQTTILEAIKVDATSLDQLLINVIPDIVYVLNFESKIILGNPALEEWFKMPLDDVIGQKLIEAIPNFEQSKFYDNFQQVLSDRQPRIVIEQFDESRNNKADQHWYEARIFPVPDGILIVVRDITRQRETDAQILEYQLAGARIQMLDEIVQNLSHDFRTPLSVLNTSLYLLEHYSDPEKQQKKLEAVKRQVAILEKMIENIILLTQLDIYHPADLSRVDVSDIVEGAVQALQPQADAKQQNLRLHVPYQSIYHMVNSEHLTCAIRNIIENAIFYTPDNGTIDVTLEPSTDHSFQIRVRDTGLGIEADDLPYIFDRFYRVNQARTVNEAGNGLGLPIAKDIIELHNGVITIVSEPNYGTEVTLVI